MAYSRYATELKDKDNNVYGVMDEEARDYKADAINVLLNTPASVMSFSDGADNLPMAMTVWIEPVQDLHGYENPWPAGGEKNKFDISTITVNKAINESGSELNVSGSSISALIDVDSGSDYTFSFVPGNTGTWSRRLHGYDANGDWVEQLGSVPSGSTGTRVSITATIPNTVKKVRISFKSDDGSIQVEKGSTATDYAPYSNICPISGWTGANVTRTGKNLYDKNATDTNKGYVANYYITESGSLASDSDLNISEYIPVIPNTLYVINPVSGNNVALCFYNSSKQYISGTKYGVTWGTYISKTFITPPNTAYIRCSIPKSKVNELTLWIENVYNISFPSSAGTVYGGELTVNKDGSGTLALDKYYKVLNGSETWTRSNANTDNALFTTILTNLNCKNAENSISNIYSYEDIKSSTTVVGFKPVNSGSDINIRVRPINASSQTVDSFTTSLATTNLQILFELATPVTYSITDGQVKTLLGVNNIWADTGNILSVNYPADTKLYIDGKVAYLEALILEN